MAALRAGSRPASSMAGVYHRSCRNFVASQAVVLWYARSNQRDFIVTANDFRRLALALPETAERAHMDHPDFRVCGKIFATLGYPAKGWGMVKLAPEQQHYFLKDYPGVFEPAKGAWGRQGATSVDLKTVGKEALRRAISAAWRNTAPKRLAELFPEDT
jgi:hypothetical protein